LLAAALAQAQPAAPGPAAAPGASAAAAAPGPLVASEGQLGAGWTVIGLPGQKPPLTRYRAERVDGRDAVRLDADGSYGNLTFELHGQPAPRRLRWSWRLQQPNARADLALREGDDTAARVCLAFDMPMQRVPLLERPLMALARSRAGETLPTATLCWVWGGAEPLGGVIDNPYTRRVRYIVLRGAADPAGRWLDEERDVAADWARSFGRESAALPPLAAVIVAADADNTGSHSIANVADLRFER
jgi:hypothetical protein